MSLNPLIKCQSDFLARKVVVVGNGAIEGGTELAGEVIRALGEEDAEIHAQLDYAVALAYYSANIGTLRKNLLFALSRYGAKNINHQQILEATNCLSAAEIVRLKISEYFKDRNLGLRSYLQQHVTDLFSSEVGIITINWDEVLYRNQKVKNLIQLHGRAEFYQSLILPTEQIQDGFIRDILRGCSDSDAIGEAVHNACRGNSLEYLKEAEARAFLWIEGASELVIAGVRMNPYDAELMQVLRRWSSTNARHYRQSRVNSQNPNLTVINIKYADAETAARFLCAREWYWINPEDNKKNGLYTLSGDFKYDLVECVPLLHHETD